MKSIRFALIFALFAYLSTTSLVRGETAASPNIVVILTDDQGYADFSYNPHSAPEVSTPHMDSLAREGVYFSQAYTSGSVCSPTRAGLMLGQYQQRVGVYSGGDGGKGFDPDLPIFPSFLPESYRSAAIGKWHLGLDEDYPELKWHAMNRGFDECYKFMGRGGHDYFELTGVKRDSYEPIYVNKRRLEENEYKGYLTTRFTEEAVDFIGREKDGPFFLYLAYNAVHAPAQAPREDVARFQKRFPNISRERAMLMAMLYHLDEGIGSVVNKLKIEGVWENTLLIFLTDNGGAKGMAADNGHLRGYKHSNYEGGIRTPWIVSWPERFKGGRVIDTPIISLDILPTVLDAIGAPGRNATTFDGKSLIPLLEGETKKHHEVLYWDNGEGEIAVRQGDWKLRGLNGQYELYNLFVDPSEEEDLAPRKPNKTKELVELHREWRSEMPAPVKDREQQKEQKSGKRGNQRIEDS